MAGEELLCADTTSLHLYSKTADYGTKETVAPGYLTEMHPTEST